MNRHAVALAADSATTVTQWIDGKREERYFKGANKLFQMSDHHPVGMMIYGTASLQRVPWEIILKDFRTNLARKSFNDVGGYASELFDFISGHGHLFPRSYQDKNFREEAGTVAAIVIYVDARNDPSIRDEKNDENRQKAYQKYIESQLGAVDKLDFIAPFVQEDVDAALAAHRSELREDLSKRLSKESDLAKVDLEKLVELSIKRLVKNYPKYLDATGVVVSGFGEHDYFPCYKEYDCYGPLLGKFLFKEKNYQRIDLEYRTAHIQSFATTSMVNTFLYGIGPDTYANLQQEIEKALKYFGDSVATELKLKELPKLAEHIEKARQFFTENWVESSWRANSMPLLRVVGSLPIDEMSELAETLIMLQSLKEKVTKPTESVGGPIDVAIVTKGDGFVWIKRKHYFDPVLNSRFFVRQQGKYC